MTENMIKTAMELGPTILILAGIHLLDYVWQHKDHIYHSKLDKQHTAAHFK